MTDTQIVDLYLSRSESAIGETAKQYGAYCASIAMNILHNKEDADECVNDAYLKLWNTIPPERPRTFSTYIGRITRNLSLNRYKSKTAGKRGGGDTALLSSELQDCIPDSRQVEDVADNNELSKAIDDFLSTLKENNMVYFIRRYWHMDSPREIAEKFGVSEGKVLMSLVRTRKKMKEYLEKRGIAI
jgi:RNA polymerase sigma-70 factor (ECF subfamily)